MLKFTIFCFIAVQVLLVQAKTYEEVVQDLAPVFQNIHDTLTLQETVAHGSERNILEGTRQAVYNLRSQLQTKIQSILTQIKTTTQTIISDNGMTDQLDAIAHCVAKKDTDSGLLYQTAISGAEVCVRLGNANVEYASRTIMTPLYNKQLAAHRSIDGVKKDCESSADAAAGLLCITNALYGVWRPELVKLEAEMKVSLGRVSTSSKYILANGEMCTSIVYETMDYSKRSTLELFKKCVVEVANNANLLD